MFQFWKICYGCQKIEQKMLACAGCEDVYYCSNECQKKDWHEHKNYCRKPSGQYMPIAKINSHIIKSSTNKYEYQLLLRYIAMLCATHQHTVTHDFGDNFVCCGVLDILKFLDTKLNIQEQKDSIFFISKGHILEQQISNIITNNGIYFLISYPSIDHRYTKNHTLLCHYSDSDSNEPNSNEETYVDEID